MSDNINADLLVIQSKLNAPKGQYNSFAKFHYRSCEDITKSVKPLLVETETSLTLSDSMEIVGDRIYVKATAALTNGKGDSVSCYGWAREAQSKKGMDDGQLTGATSSYARKYALNGLFAIDDNKDMDTDEYNKPVPKEKKKESVKTPPQGYNSANFFDELNICQSPAEIEKLLKSPNTAKWYKNLLPEQEKIVDDKVMARTKQVTTEALT